DDQALDVVVAQEDRDEAGVRGVLSRPRDVALDARCRLPTATAAVAARPAEARADVREDRRAEVAADFPGRELTERRSGVARGRYRRRRHRPGTRGAERRDPRVHPARHEIDAREEAGEAG